MLERFVQRYRRINPPPPPEDSTLLRISVLATVLVAIGSISFQEILPPLTSLLAAGGVVAGSIFSWFRRDKDNWPIKLFISLLLFPVFANFVGSVLRIWYDPRIPLAEMFLWMQVLHSFDLPGRRDLMFSLLSALAILIMGAVISGELVFGLFIILFVALGLFSLYLARLSELGIRIEIPGSFKTRLKLLSIRVFQIFGIASIIFVFTPRLPQMQIEAFPFSSARLRIPNFSGDLFNNAYPLKLGQFPMSSQPFVRGSYPGFTPFMDLRMRGLPAGELMIRVRASEPCYFRGVVFDKYNGVGWTITKGKMVRLSSRVPPVNVPIAFSDRSREVIQTFYIEKNHPNVVFAAYKPSQLYFPGLEMWMDPAQSLRSPFMMDAGIVYTCISRVKGATFSELKTGGKVRKTALMRYRRLPALPGRVKELALRLTQNEVSDYEKAQKLSSYLRTNLAYDLETSPPQKGHDAVDDFIFNKKRGGCEQFASALAVMCRLVSIPSRVVSGYAEGTNNPFTGYYEIMDSDAHAWVEIFLGRNGWVILDPTPGFIPPSKGNAQFFILGELLKYLKKSVFLREFISSTAGIVRGVGQYTGAWGFGVVALALVAAALAAATRAKKTASALDEATKLYLSMCTSLKRNGFDRTASQTPSEFALKTFAATGLNEVIDITHFYESHRYGNVPTGTGELEQMRKLVASLFERLKSSFSKSNL